MEDEVEGLLEPGIHIGGDGVADARVSQEGLGDARLPQQVGEGHLVLDLAGQLALEEHDPRPHGGGAGQRLRLLAAGAGRAEGDDALQGQAAVEQEVHGGHGAAGEPAQHDAPLVDPALFRDLAHHAVDLAPAPAVVPGPAEAAGALHPGGLHVADDEAPPEIGPGAPLVHHRVEVAAVPVAVQHDRQRMGPRGVVPRRGHDLEARQGLDLGPVPVAPVPAVQLRIARQGPDDIPALPVDRVEPSGGEPFIHELQAALEVTLLPVAGEPVGLQFHGALGKGLEAVVDESQRRLEVPRLEARVDPRIQQLVVPVVHPSSRAHSLCSVILGRQLGQIPVRVPGRISGSPGRAWPGWRPPGPEATSP